MPIYQPEATLCPIGRVQRLLGERWTLQILNEIFIARGRFDEIEAQLGITPIMLNERLRKLQTEGLIERRLYNPSPARYEFVLTDKGRSLFPVMSVIRAWGEIWCKPDSQEPALQYRHNRCGGIAGQGPSCQACGEPVDDMTATVEFLPEYAAERAARQDAFHERRHIKRPLKRRPKIISR
ncbi:MAG: transcriptional regulator [Phenylobacterium zucineum]|nr:MAG: transcriptional regulator [Phenylobacterium zucineum]